jgi:MFS superfamily sulfate permease-like transporter
MSFKEILKTILSGILLSVIIIPQSMAFTIMIGIPA